MSKRKGSAAKHGTARVQPIPGDGPARRRSLFPIVGIGASAGGLEAMTALLGAWPENPGLAIVLVQHLDPTHESAMASLLSRATAMPVLEARNGQTIELNHIYIIAPNKLMVMAGRRLQLSPRTPSKDTFAPIDHFLKSLAREEADQAIGVVLSGSGGSDGTQGMLAIKAAGGITFAQNEKSARYPNMPASAVAAGCVDFVLPPEQIARELGRLAGHLHVRHDGWEAERKLPAAEKAFDEVLSILRRQMAVDFSQYKHATLQRRLHRRIVLLKFESLKDYAAYLRAHPAEVRELFNDVLIHVTGFFRDPSVFQTLKRSLLPRLLKGRAPDNPIRIWVPGCSTGEEVYSLAMVLLEVLNQRQVRLPVHVYATDIDEPALEKARAGVYPDAIEAEIPPDRLRRFFLKCEKGYRINKAVRQMCIFARQNLVTDPPFSNLDLISCRNVLIYFGPALQRKVMPLFHYALKPSGHLLLGASETIGGFADLFALEDKKAKIYSKKSIQTRSMAVFGRSILPDPVVELASPGPVVARVEPAAPLTEIQKQADRILLAHLAPAGVVVNRQLEVLQFRGRTGPYLEHSHGEATLSLLKMCREGLTVGVRAALGRAMEKNVRVRQERIQVKWNGGYKETSVEVVPFQVPPSRERFYLVLFDTLVPGPLPAKSRRLKGRGRKAVEHAEVARLREDLDSTRQSLQAIIEEQDATNEELHSANEEIMSSNEELQSTNEELETAKEELQSTNEELTTLNDELESRNGELELVNNDLQNLLASVNIAVIIVAPDLRIRRFTAVAEKMLNLIPTDSGRPLTDINLKLDLPQLPRIVTEVIDTLQPHSYEAKDSNGQRWSVHVRPYKTSDNKIEGAVIALLAIDLPKSEQEEVRSTRL